MYLGLEEELDSIEVGPPLSKQALSRGPASAKAEPKAYHSGGYRGLFWTESHSTAKGWVRQIQKSKHLGITARSRVVKPSQKFPKERYLVLIPDWVDDTTAKIVLMWKAEICQSPSEAS